MRTHPYSYVHLVCMYIQNLFPKKSQPSRHVGECLLGLIECTDSYANKQERSNKLKTKNVYF